MTLATLQNVLYQPFALPMGQSIAVIANVYQSFALPLGQSMAPVCISDSPYRWAKAWRQCVSVSPCRWAKAWRQCVSVFRLTAGPKHGASVYQCFALPLGQSIAVTADWSVALRPQKP